MCTRTFSIEIGMFLCNLKTLKQNENVLMCSKIFETKAEFFHLIKKFWNKTKRFDLFQNFLKQKQNFSI